MTPALIAALLAAAALVDAPDPGAAGGASGLWRTSEDHGVVEVAPCGEALCGRIIFSDRIKAFPNQTDVRNADQSLRGRPIKGLSIFYGLKGGPPTWTGGKIYNPNDGKTYEGSLRILDADRLELTGCVFRPLCRSQIWTRIR